VAKTAAGTFVSKRYSKRRLERAAFQTDPARSTRERLDNADTSATYDANGRRAKEDAAAEKQQTRTEVVRAAKAKITRQNSLRKQRDAQRG
jgi:hypothetical protein